VAIRASSPRQTEVGGELVWECWTGRGHRAVPATRSTSLPAARVAFMSAETTVGDVFGGGAGRLRKKLSENPMPYCIACNATLPSTRTGSASRSVARVPGLVRGRPARAGALHAPTCACTDRRAAANHSCPSAERAARQPARRPARRGTSWAAASCFCWDCAGIWSPPPRRRQTKRRSQGRPPRMRNRPDVRQKPKKAPDAPRDARGRRGRRLDHCWAGSGSERPERSPSRPAVEPADPGRASLRDFMGTRAWGKRFCIIADCSGSMIMHNRMAGSRMS